MFRPLAAAGTADEARAARAAYAAIPAAVDFSRQILQRAPEALAVMRVNGIDWNDLGDPDRVLATRRELEWNRVPA